MRNLTILSNLYHFKDASNVQTPCAHVSTRLIIPTTKFAKRLQLTNMLCVFQYVIRVMLSAFNHAVDYMVMRSPIVLVRKV